LRSVAPSSLTSPGDFAKEALASALHRVPAESEGDLRSAIDRIADVAPSPLYCPNAAQTSRLTRRVV
jgi:hypothetical protein